MAVHEWSSCWLKEDSVLVVVGSHRKYQQGEAYSDCLKTAFLATVWRRGWMKVETGRGKAIVRGR
jgi:hypothetical protein